MWQLIAKIFGSKQVIGAAISGIDKSIFTREEQADYTLKIMKAYEPFKLAQRLLAVMFSAVFLLAFIVTFGFFTYGSVTDSEMIISASREMLNLTWEVLGTPISLIVGFYFMGGLVNGINKKK
jgi:hypothetical protein